MDNQHYQHSHAASPWPLATIPYTDRILLRLIIQTTPPLPKPDAASRQVPISFLLSPVIMKLIAALLLFLPLLATATTVVPTEKVTNLRHRRLVEVDSNSHARRRLVDVSKLRGSALRELDDAPTPFQNQKKNDSYKTSASTAQAS